MLIIYKLATVLLFITGIGIIYQSIATVVDDYRYPPLGKLVDIGTHKLHINSMGEGGPVVILDAGLSGTSLGWSLVQSEVSKFTKVYSYDRAGYAWSDESPLKRTSYNIAEELHTLLHKENVAGPYILVGHSFGGCNMLMFANRYPEETLGVVLVDSVHEDMLKELPEPQRSVFERSQWILSMVGYKRIKGPSAEIEQMFQPLPKEIKNIYVAQMNKTNYTKTIAREMACLNESLLQLGESQVHLQDKALFVISAGIVPNDAEGKIWSNLQKKLLIKSNRAKQMIAKKATI